MDGAVETLSQQNEQLWSSRQDLCMALDLTGSSGNPID
jgi:hypothetical protein